MVADVRRVARSVFAALLCLTATAASAEKRVALVIGNSAYRSVATLPNPINDGADVAAALERLAFKVTRVDDATFDAMRRSLNAFGEAAADAEMAVIFFAGHGIEVGGENWLIPVDAALKSDRNIEGEAVSLRFALQQASGASKLSLVVLDACRNNPFAARMARTSARRAVDRGLARVEPTTANTLVAYAARDGTTASDGSEHNSPFTAALLLELETPGLEVRFLFARVRDSVMKSTQREQEPFTYASLSAEQVFLKPAIVGQDFAIPPAGSGRSNVHEIWDHNGSKLRLDKEGAERRFVYIEPREGIRNAGVTSGMTGFEGTQTGTAYSGTAYVFSSTCGRISFPVSGEMSADGRTVTMRGSRPYVSPLTCQRVESEQAVLKFEIVAN